MSSFFRKAAPKPPPPPPPPPPNQQQQQGQQQQQYGQHQQTQPPYDQQQQYGQQAQYGQQQQYQYPQATNQYYQQQQQQQPYGQTASQPYAAPQQQHYQYSQGQYNQQQYAAQAPQQGGSYYGQTAAYGGTTTPSYAPTQPATTSASSYGAPAATNYASQYSAQPQPPAAPAAPPAPAQAQAPPLKTESPAAATTATTTSSYAANAVKGNQAAAPSSNEPYGEVIPSASATGGLTHRSDAKRHLASPQAAPPAYSYGGGGGASYGSSAAPSAYGGAGAMNFFQQSSLEYQHNRMTVLFLVPPLLAVFWSASSPYPIQTLIFLTLAMYGMDLANAREFLSVFLWVSAAILTMVTGWFMLLDAPDEEDGGLSTLAIMLRTAGNMFLFLCLAAWCTLQFQWLHADAPSWAVSVERMLHAMLPPVAAAIVSFFLSGALVAELGVDLSATLTPHFFALLLVSGMVFLGCCESSFVPSTQSNSNGNNKQKDKSDDDDKDKGKRASLSTKETYILPTRYARAHSTILLLVPALMHIMMFRRRVMSTNVTKDDWLDLILIWTIPYMLHYTLHTLHMTGRMHGPYNFPSSCINNILFPRAGNTLRGTFVPLVISLVASVSVQQRYLIPLCHQVSYQFKGHDLPSSEMVSIFLSAGTFFVVVGGWIWGAYSTETGEPLFGEFHEDVVQLLFALAGMVGGLAFGMPWGLIPLPILAFLGLSLWLTTRLLRYLAVFLFVVHATGVVLFSYRFAGMDNEIELAMPGVSLTLTRFGILVVLVSVVVGFLAGLAVRSNGGYGAKWLKKLDVAGMLLLIYSVLLAVLEFTLLTRPLPAKELAGIELDVTEVEDEEMLYDDAYAYLTAGLIVVIALCMQYNKSISSFYANIALSTAVAKAVVVFIDGTDESTSIDLYEASDAVGMFFRFLSATLLLVVMFIPRAVLKPIHVKSKYYKRSQASLASGGIVDSLPRTARPMIILYSFIMLPACLIVSVPTVILPFIGACGSIYGGAYYDVSPPISVILGYISCFWGVASLSMLNHYLPDSGGELFKRFSALTFLMSIGLIFAAPALPDWAVDGVMMMGAGKMPKSMLEKAVNNPYATLSSIGVQLIRGKKSRSGGWGLVAAIFATLLAITGPLELRERKHPTGRKDKMFLFRLMTFSIMFGCGVSWFIVMQSMSGENFLPMILTAASCMAVSFFGTVATALGYHLELDSFDEAIQVAYVWVASFPLFLGISSIPQFVLKGKVHPFGAGGWLSTYLSIYGVTSLLFALALRSRKTKSKDTRATGNVSCVFAFVCAIAVLYGRFGVAGLDSDFDVATVLGIPISILGTFLAAPILLALEGENSSQGRGARLKKIAGAGAKAKSKLFSFMNIHNLNSTTKYVPPLLGCVTVFLYASLYVILIRGSGFVVFETVASNHEEVYKSAAGSKDGNKNALEDLAALYQKATLQNKAMYASAKLAGAGFWTSSDIFGPLLHLGGVAACLPSLYLLTRYLWSGGGASTKTISAAAVTLALPLNAIPIFLCRGIPSLQAAAWVGLIGGLLQLMNMKALDRQAKMRI